jgi:hypothetical protein
MPCLMRCVLSWAPNRRREDYHTGAVLFQLRDCYQSDFARTLIISLPTLGR